MRILTTLAAAFLLLGTAAAQRTLDKLQAEFIAQSRKLAAERPNREQQQELLGRQIEQLQAFLANDARDADRWNGTLMLADLQLARGQRQAAGEALRRIDPAAAPALLLVSAAGMAQHLNLRELREAFVTAAVKKPAPLADRLAMARLLSTVLHEVDKGEAVFAAALEAATDDEQRALVRWHRADGLRDREDLSDNAGFEELEKLAAELPNTYWGSVAHDRLRATRLAVGDMAIDFKARSRSGGEVSLAGLRGKTVALVFWSLADRDTKAVVDLVQAAAQQRPERLAIVGVCLDRDVQEIDAAIKALGIKFPVVGEGKGIETDAALRWFVEGPTVHVLGPDGKVKALGLHAGTADARSQLTELLTN